jgi:uncharacterized membrane protein
MNLPESRLGLMGLAFAAGAAIVLAGNAVTDLVLGRAPFADGTVGSIDALDVAILHLVVTLIPMIALALAGSRALVLWATTILTTVCFWAYFVWQIWQDSLTGFAGGANIGLGLIMLGSPFVVLAVVCVVALFRRALART